MKILVLGGTGMAGHTVSIYFQEQGFDVTVFTRAPIDYCKNIVGDAFDKSILEEIICSGSYDVIINCIGLLNKNCDKFPDKAVYLNSYLPHYIAEITKEEKTKIIHISTDCVFSGKGGPYYENSWPDGETFYDRTKAVGELKDDKNLTFRCSIIGPDINKDGIGLFNWMMHQSGSIQGYSKVIWSGITTIELCRAIYKALSSGLVGLYHLSPNESISKKDLLQKINEVFSKNLTIIPYDGIVSNKILINTRTDFDFAVHSYHDMIVEMRDWIYNHKKFYRHYFKMA